MAGYRDSGRLKTRLCYHIILLIFLIKKTKDKLIECQHVRKKRQKHVQIKFGFEMASKWVSYILRYCIRVLEKSTQHCGTVQSTQLIGINEYV